MIKPGHPTGVVVYRIAPTGTTPVILCRVWQGADTSGGPGGFFASVCSKGQRQRWALRPMTIWADDVFSTREEARAEYRRRHAAALARNPHASRNVVTQ